MAFVFTLMGVYAMNALDGLLADLNSGETRFQTIVAAATEASSYAKRAEGHIMLFLTLGERRDREKFYARCAALDEQLAILRLSVRDEKARAMLAEMETATADLRPLGESLLSAAAPPRPYPFGAHREEVVRLNEIVSRIRQLGVDLAKREAELAAGEKARFYGKMLAVRRNFSLLALSLMLVACALGCIMARALSRPLRDLAVAANRIGRGELGLTVPATSRDEIGDLARSLNAMSLQLHASDQQLRASNQQLRAANQQLQASQEALVRSERLAAAGQLAAGIAHEFNNILTSILLQADFVKVQPGVQCDVGTTRLMDSIIEQSQRGAKVVKGILALARPSSVDLKPVPLYNLVEQVLSVQRRQLDIESIQVRNEVPRDLVCRIDNDQIQQVLLNLVLNARDAMAGSRGGTLSFAAEQDAREVRLAVSDTGVGMSEEVRQRIFTPFFTTKGAFARDGLGQKGTGLGLAVSYAIMSRHGGEIRVMSRPGGGTVFTLVIPRRTEERDEVE